MAEREIDSDPVALAKLAAKLPTIFFPNDTAAEKFVECFLANIRNKQTRRAYYEAACRFSEWCDRCGLLDLGQVKPFHISSYLRSLESESAERELAAANANQQMAGLRTFFDWLVVGHILDANPAKAVHSPTTLEDERRGPMLDRKEGRAILSAIDPSTLTGLRDRAIIGVMVRTSAGVRPVLQMNVDDYFRKGAGFCVRVHVSGKEKETPCTPKLDQHLNEYIAAAGILTDKEGPLFRTIGRPAGTIHRLAPQDVYRLIHRYVKRREKRRD